MSDPSFYIGRKDDKPFEMKSTDFLTHAVVLGASGSGKTVMCKSIVEEGIRNNVPVIAIDPKGDIGALGIGLHDFTEEKIILHAQVEADDRGGNAQEIAAEWISLYRKKLEGSYGDEYEEVEQDFSDKVAAVLITPKNASGIQISLTPNFEQPKNYKKLMSESPDEVLSTIDLKIQLLLSRCGIKTSSSTDNRVIFVSNIIRHYWEKKKKKNVTLAELITSVEEPPFDSIGSLSVDKFISKNKRSQLARSINALMVRAVPGVDLNFDKLINLAKKDGKTPIIVFDLRKITDADEKNAFVAEILGEIQRWVWNKGGTSRLRAILYFDELYGFMPAGSLSPPSKTALLILLKQARAAGLGCVLATQNPGDLDYRGLANIATWILGRLATNQDIAKVQGALKPVFEGAGGTEEEFRDLMGQIRALKPGNFIAYNASHGVNAVNTRWLLSLHKGPLTDKEIAAITLKPKIVKKEKKEEKSIEKVDEKEEPEFDLSAKKQSLGKITERFLVPRIEKEHQIILNLVHERLSLMGNKDLDGFSVLLNESKEFYSPIYFTKSNISMKREIAEGEMILPIIIKEEMDRSFDLTKSIQWDRTTIEGIHTNSLPPTDLDIQPVENVMFYHFDKTLVDKLPDNIVWYFTNSPLPDVEKIYHKNLRDYEAKQLNLLVKKSGKKDLAKLTKEVNKIEERMSVDNSKIDEAKQRIDLLKEEMRAREAEGKSIKAIERSLESTENKIRNLEDKTKSSQKDLQRIEKKRKEIMEEQKEQYDSITNWIKKMQKKGPPRNLYRPEAADIKISEKTVYWIPRLLVPVDLKHENTTESLEINFNLYNGNAEISCDACGTEISTEDYYQSLLEQEISPPIFICSVCLKPYCSEHIVFCNDCGKKTCLDHSLNCALSNVPLCTDCAVMDKDLKKYVSKAFVWQCASCQEYFNDKVESKRGEIEKKPVCPDCAKDYLVECASCGKFYAKENAKFCDGCKKAFCESHLTSCRKCEAKVCDKCGTVKVKLKGEEVVARCLNCT